LPPLLALALCSAFVILLLRLDRKRSKGVTRALWIPTIWMLYISGRPIALWLQTESTNPDAGSPIDLVFQAIIMLLAISVLFRKHPDLGRVFRENAWLAALLVFMLVSAGWSSMPLTSLKRWIRELQAVLIAFVVFSEASPRLALESLLRRTIYVLIPLSLTLIKYFPLYGVEYGRWSGGLYWIGVAQQKNGLALLCIISALFLIWSLVRDRHAKSPISGKYQTQSDVILLLLTLYLLGGPQHSLFYSATSTYAFLAGLGMCAWIYLRKRSVGMVKAGLPVAIISGLIVLGVVSLFVGGSGIGFFASSAGRNATLTGRTEVWASLLPVVTSNPIGGCGFGGFWTSRTREYYQISGAHSGYLDVLLGVGFLGLVLVSVFLTTSCWKACRELQDDLFWALLWLGLVTMSAVHNIGESSIDSFTSPLSAILLFFAVASVARPVAPQESPEG
jgi:exopolysaccharide production protein ExoQ